jgi:hypothetical protein
VAPENSAGIHLKALARISRLFRNPEFREAILKAPDAGRIYALIAEKTRAREPGHPTGHDVFLEEVAFPALAVGVVDAASGLGKLLEWIADERVAWLLGRVLDRTVGGSFFGLVDDEWLELVHVLLFSEWERRRDGWHVAREHPATPPATSWGCTWR